MNITAIGGTVNYTPSNTSQNSSQAAGAQSASSSGGGTPSGGTSQAASASSGSGSTSSSSSTSSASAVYDPQDLNQDGIVTYAEEMQYALTHPLAAQQSQSSSVQSYNQQGQTTGAASATQSTISVYA